MQAIGIDICLTYDDGSRGSRLLDRARLSVEQQRLILVGSNQSLIFDSIRSALMLQFPEHKPAPPVAGREASTAPYQQKGQGKGNAGGTASSSTSAPSNNQSGKSGGKFGGKGFNKGAKRVFQTEHEGATVEDENELVDNGDEFENDGNPDEGDEQVEDSGHVEEDPNDDETVLSELAEVLTVTARKLANVTQGRKFSGQPKKSIQEKKKNFQCASCGAIRHWAGDPECENTIPSDAKSLQVSTATSSKGKSKGQKGRDDRGAGDAKKVMTVYHSSGFDTTVEYLPPEERPHPHFAMVCMAPLICLTNYITETTGYMLMDTACQRSCCGVAWSQAQAAHLRDFKLKAYHEASHENFQFGSGAPVRSTEKIWFPCGIEGHCMVFGVNVVDAEIPFLGSLRLMTQLGAVIDCSKNEVYFGALDVTTPLCVVRAGHLAVP